jgi:hypothetical protein
MPRFLKPKEKRQKPNDFVTPDNQMAIIGKSTENQGDGHHNL